MGVGSEGKRYYKELVDVIMEASLGFLDDLTGGDIFTNWDVETADC